MSQSTENINPSSSASKFMNEVVELVEDEYKCSICVGYLKKPRMTICGHKFCHACIESWLSEHQSCPICKQNLQMNSDTFPDKFTERKISELRIKCPNAEKGCQHKMFIDEFEEHAAMCVFSPSLKNGDGTILCPFSKMGCDKTFKSEKELENHKKEFMENHLKMTINAYNNVTLDNCHERKKNQKQIEQIDELHAKVKKMDKLSLTTMFYRGSLVWAIENFSERCQKDFELKSPPFYSSPHKYKYLVRVSFFDRSLNVLVLLTYSENDSKLKWPCKIKNCTISILKHLEDSNKALVHPKIKSMISASRSLPNQTNIIFNTTYYKHHMDPYLHENRLWIKVCIELDEDQ